MMKFRVKLICLLIAFCVISSATLNTLAQTTTSGAIEGRVYEEGSSLGIAGATVTLRNQETGLTRTAVTDQTGRYFIGTLPPGFYRISATAQGYAEGLNSSESNFPINITETKRVQPPPISLRRVGVAPPTPGTPTAPVTPTTPVTPATQPPQTQPQTSSALPQASSAFEQLVNLTNASRGGSVDRRQIIILPLPGVRTFDDFAFLFAGVAPPPQPIGNSVGPGIGPGVGTTGQFAVNGIRSRSNNFTMDGSDNNDEEVGVRRQGFTSLVPQPIESVQEFQIITLLAEPQFGRNMGAQVNGVSRAGGIDYHGTVYGFLTDKRLRARDRFDLTDGPATFPILRAADGRQVTLDGRALAPANPSDGENPYTRAQYGFVLGGPFGSPKTNFFVSFERQDINASRESHFAVPTVEERGLFGFGAVGLQTIQTDERGNPLPPRPVLPASPIGSAFFSLFPFPNNPLGPYGRNTFTEVLPANADGMIFSIRLDRPTIRAFGVDHSLIGRYNFTDDDTTLPVTGEAIFSSLRAMVRTQNLSLIFNSNFSSRFLSQARFSFGRTTLGFQEVRNPRLLRSSSLPNEPFLLNAPFIVNATLPTFNNDGTLRAGDPSFLTFPGFNSESFTGPLGQLKVSGFSPLGVDVFNFPQGRTNNTFQYADTFFYNLADHRFTFGFDIRRNQLNSFLERNFRPLAVFSAAADISPSQLATQISPLKIPFFFGSDFVSAGAPTGFYQTQALVRDSTIGLRYWQNNFFVSDQIRVSPTFTLTLGLRYEINSVPREVNNRIENTFNSNEVQRFEAFERSDFGRSGLEQFLAGRTGIFNRDENNFGPHIAIAWDPSGDGRTSVRAGFGIYYDQIPGAVISQSRNVFPSFLTLNLAGLDITQVGLPENPVITFPFANPAGLAVPGTLNQFMFQSPSDAARLFSRASNFSAGPAFVLPASDLVTPYAEHWGLTVEHQFGRDFLASAGYVGTRGVHLLRFATPNLGPNGIPRVDQIIPIDFIQVLFPGFRGANEAPRTGGAAGRPFPLLGAFTSIESDSNSIYHGLQLQLIKKWSGGIQLTGAYTWSHAIDEVSDLFDTAGANALPQNSFDRKAERASASFDVRHRFVYSAIWDLPFWRDNNFLGGWQVASIGTFQTGQPYSVLFCCDLNLDGNLTDRVSDPGLSDAGMSGRNNFRAPGVATVDATVNKVFRFNEYRNLEFRTEVFNLFNRTHFGIPVRQLFFGGVGLSPLTNETFVDTRIPARTIQFALKYSF